MGSEVLICKRCGKPLVRIDYKRKGSRVYAYGLHREVLPDGKVRWYYHYLGPVGKYEHVTRLHEDVFPQGLKGYTYELEGGSRRKDYLQDLARSLRQEMESHTLPSKEAMELVGVIEGLCALVGDLRQYAEEKAKEEAELARAEEAVNETVAKSQPLEAPPKTSQPQTTEARQDKAEAYRAVSALTGLSAEDIERQLAKLKEALRELKASH